MIFATIIFAGKKGVLSDYGPPYKSDLSNLALNEFTVLALTMSSGNAFQGFITQFVKNLFRISQFITIFPT